MKKPKDAILFLRNKLEENKSGLKSELYIRYGLAYAYLLDNAFSHANQQVKHLLKNDDSDPAFLLLAARLSSAQSNYESALDIYAKAYGLYPEHKPILVAYTRALIDVEKAKEAREIIKHYERYHPHDLNSYSLLGQVEAMLGNEIETAIIHSEYYYLSGETRLAIEKLNMNLNWKKTLNYRCSFYDTQGLPKNINFEYCRSCFRAYNSHKAFS